jgi:hypothetical protein
VVHTDNLACKGVPSSEKKGSGWGLVGHVLFPCQHKSRGYEYAVHIPTDKRLVMNIKTAVPVAGGYFDVRTSEFDLPR